MNGNQHMVVKKKYTNAEGRRIVQVQPADKFVLCKECRANPRAQASSRCTGCSHANKVKNHNAGRLQLKINEQQQKLL